MSKGRAEIRQRLKNGVAESNNERIRIRRNKKKESNFNLESYKQYISIICIALVVCGLCGYFGKQYYLYYKINLARQPLQIEKIISNNISDKNSLFWGTYRPQLYFGVKHRSSASLLGGLMWFNQYGRQQLPNIRYWCNNDDKLLNFGWQLHDLRNFGRQKIVDSRQVLTTSFIKRGSDWMGRIEVAAKQNVETSLMWYMYLPDMVRGYIRPIIEHDRLIGLQGSTVELGDFKINFNFNINNTKTRHHESYLVGHVSRDDKILQAVESGIGFDESRRQLRLVGHMPLPRTISENIWVFEITANGDFVLDIIFESSNEKSNDRLNSDTFQKYFDKYSERFHEKFHSLFRIEPGVLFSNKQIELAKSALSNLAGGIGYFYGSSIVRSKYSNEDNQPLFYWPSGLFTATPSRTIFPRGFLWDEGFHCLLLGRWDPEATFDIIGHWLDLLNAEGWIPREQILGWEARAKVPDEFIIQDNRNGNPPTLVLCLEDFDERFNLLDKETQVTFKKFLLKALPRLETWYKWFNTTQLGQGLGNYQWKGRNLDKPGLLNPLTLTSGLDDYPRASHPSDEERHLDLRCWMTMFTRVLAKLRQRINLDPEPYLSWSKILMDEKLLNEAHFYDEGHMFSDYGLHTEAVSLVRPPPVDSQNPHQHNNPDKIRKVYQPPKLSFVPHFGYVNLFPLIMKILSPSSPKLGLILNDLENPNLLWTKFGLRSLAKNSSFYQRHNSEHDPPYWRGAIWININYLTIRSLAHYSKLPGPYQSKSKELYQSLMLNVVNNVLDQMKHTGYMWEQYDDSTGKGQRGHPFSGWTSLVVMSMAHL